MPPRTIKKRAPLAWRIKHACKTVSNAITGQIAVWTLSALRKTDPQRCVDFFGSAMRKLGPWLPEHRVGRANLVAAFPEKSSDEIEQILCGAWDNLGRIGAEFAHLDRLWDVDPVTLTSNRIEAAPGTMERYARLRDDGKPALVFAAHLANWELAAIAAAAQGVKSAVLYRGFNSAAVERKLAEIRKANMGLLIRNGLDAPARLGKALENGIHVGLLVDQYYSRGVDVTFFGRRTKANPLIARLAGHVDCPIHGVRVIRLPNHRFRLEITEAIEPVRDKDGKIEVAATMQVITSIVEQWVREYPDQWLWLHRRWR